MIIYEKYFEGFNVGNPIYNNTKRKIKNMKTSDIEKNIEFLYSQLRAEEANCLNGLVLRTFCKN